MRYVWMARAALPQLPGGSCACGFCIVGELAGMVDVGFVDATGTVSWLWIVVGRCVA